MRRISIGGYLCSIGRNNRYIGPGETSVEKLKDNFNAIGDKSKVVPGLGSGPIYYEGRRSRAFSPSITGR